MCSLESMFETKPLTKSIFGYIPVYSTAELKNKLVMVLRIEKGVKTNIDRNNVSNIMNALYRAKKAIVHEFYSVYDNKSYSEGYNKQGRCFELGEILEEPNFDTIATNETTNGIKFYTNKRIAEHASLANARDVKVVYNDNIYDNFGNGMYCEYHPNGSQKLQIDVQNGKYYGAYTEWYQNGQLKSQGYYKNDLEEGPYTEYYKNGQVALQSNYETGKINGVYKQYFSSGQLEFETTYLEDKIHGIAKEYNNTGEMIFNGVYYHGKLQSVVHAKNKLTMHEITDNQSMVDAEYYDTPIKNNNYNVYLPASSIKSI